jgi:hypothetical protein
LVGWKTIPFKGVEASVPVPAGWVKGGEVAQEEPSVETVRGEGEASPDGTGGDTGTGLAPAQRGRNRVLSINQSRDSVMNGRMTVVSFFLVFFLTCPRSVPVPTVRRYFFSFFFGQMRIFGECKQGKKLKEKKASLFASSKQTRKLKLFDNYTDIFLS